MQETCIVVPCFNEADRLNTAAWERLGRHPAIRLLFVDDGSTDGTRTLLRRLVKRLPPDRAAWCALPANAGKGEAVRFGLRRALMLPVAWVGYVDADLATPIDEVMRLVQESLHRGPEVVMGCRIRLLGHDISRSALRHYLGRIFATFASWALAIPVYDTQCGTKFFRCGPHIAAALREPFQSRWIFDVELLGRLLYPAGGAGLPVGALKEAPLQVWNAQAGSKVRPRDFSRAAVDLARIWHTLRRRRRQNLIAPSSGVASADAVKPVASVADDVRFRTR
jgi:dolichyl-phosphate beta-glucosyltransferase